MKEVQPKRTHIHEKESIRSARALILLIYEYYRLALAILLKYLRNKVHLNHIY